LKPQQLARIKETGYAAEKLKDIGRKMCQIPKHITVHKQLQKIIAAREKTIIDGNGIDFGTAEALAFGTLLLEGASKIWCVVTSVML
jgi:2-oxoglutarate dehydrogenase E1 component